MNYKLFFLIIGLALTVKTAVAETTYLTAKQMLNVKTGRMVDNPLIIIEAGKISRVLEQGQIKIPPQAKQIKLPELTLLPGLMDMHVHLTFSPTRFGYQGLAISVPRQALIGARHAQDTLKAGFTTVRNLGASGYSDIALKQAIDEGDLPGPRLFVSGPALGITGGHCDNNLLPQGFNVKAAGVADGPWAAVAKVREVTKYGANTIKICATGGVMSKGTKVGVQQYSLTEMKAIVDEAHRKGLTVAAHAHGTDGIKSAIKAGVDSIEHASFLDDEAIALAKSHGTTFTMDIYVTDYILTEAINNGVLPESIEKEKQTGALQRHSFQRAVAAGVNLVFGTDAAIFPHGDNAKQFPVMVAHGMTPLQAIQSATINAAKLLNKHSELGQIEPGFFADIIGVVGNPLAQITNLQSVAFVMKGGDVYVNDSTN